MTNRFSLLKATLSFAFILFLSGCHKDVPTPELPPPPVTGGNAGINYQAHAICDYNPDETVLTSSGWNKVFEDNFDSNLSQWNIWTGGGYNEELQYYQGNNMQIQNGTLVITPRKETVTGVTNPNDKTLKTFKYTSGRIFSKATFSANTGTPKVRISARIKLPKGFGMFPVFLSSGSPWPTQGEIDLVDGDGGNPFSYRTIYYFGTTSPINLVNNAFGFINTDADLTSCFHVYETEWSQNALTYYLDGKVVETKTSGGYVPNLFGKTQTLSLYVSVVSDFITRGQIQTNPMYVDWVKVFTAK